MINDHHDIIHAIGERLKSEIETWGCKASVIYILDAIAIEQYGQVTCLLRLHGNMLSLTAGFTENKNIYLESPDSIENLYETLKDLVVKVSVALQDNDSLIKASSDQ